MRVAWILKNFTQCFWKIVLLKWCIVDAGLLWSCFLVTLFINSQCLGTKKKPAERSGEFLKPQGTTKTHEIHTEMNQNNFLCRPLTGKDLYLEAHMPHYLFLCPTLGHGALQAWYPSSPGQWLLLCYSGKQYVELAQPLVLAAKVQRHLFFARE